MTLYQNSTPGSSFQTYSAPSGLVKIVRSIQGAAPLANYFAPSGLKPHSKKQAINLESGIRQKPDKFRHYPDYFFILYPLPLS